MNGLVVFRLCTLTDKELVRKVDEMSDKMFEENKIPPKTVPARPDDDFDLLLGELIYRFNQRVDNDKKK